MQISGSQLKKAVKKENLSQERAAQLLGVTRQTLLNWFKLPELDPNTLHKVKFNLHINFGEPPNEEKDIETSVVNEPSSNYSAYDIDKLIDVVKIQTEELVRYGTRMDRILSLMDKLYGVKFIEPDNG